MNGGKPTTPESLMGTLSSSDHNFAHTSNPTNIKHRYCAVAALNHSKPFGPVKYIRSVAFSPDSLRAFFYGETISIRYSTTMKSLFLTTYKSVLLESESVALMTRSHH